MQNVCQDHVEYQWLHFLFELICFVILRLELCGHMVIKIENTAGVFFSMYSAFSVLSHENKGRTFYFASLHILKFRSIVDEYCQICSQKYLGSI